MTAKDPIRKNRTKRLYMVEGMSGNGISYSVYAPERSEVSGEPWYLRRLIYLDIQQPGVGALWQMDVVEMQADEMTETILEQWGQCYGIGIERLAQKREENR